MKAMLLAAGRGERMRPLTDSCPKPLLKVGGKPLLQWHIENLVRAGIIDIVINHAHLGEQIVAAFGDGAACEARIVYSAETQGALETAGGIMQALPMLGDEPFLVISGDIHCAWPVARALECSVGVASGQALAHLVMVPNPGFHPDGDFYLHDGRLSEIAPPAMVTPADKLTFGNIGIYHPALFADLRSGESAKLGPLLRNFMATGHVTGEYYAGPWTNVGTPEQLKALDQRLGAAAHD